MASPVEDPIENNNTPSKDVAPKDGDQEVVNVDHLMAWVTEHRELGSAKFKLKKLPEAIADYETALSAIAQTEGLPMLVDDVRTVCAAKSQLFSNIANCYFQQQLYQRCADAATKALQADGNNVKAPYWRAKAHECLKEYLLAIEDLELLGELKNNGMPDSDRQTWIDRLRKQQDIYDATFDDRLEEAQNSSVRVAKDLFEEVVHKYGFNSDKFADEVADYCVRPDASPKGLAAIYQIDEDDAITLMKWVEQASRMRQALTGGGQVQLPIPN